MILGYRVSKWERQGGFTLVELLVVAAILLILAVIAIPVYGRITDNARETVGKTDISAVEKALEEYRAANGYYPSRLGLLVDGGYIRSQQLETRWSTPERRLYYFYAVDVLPPQRALGYALGDPGPKPTRGCDPETKTTTLNTGQSLPCGRSPEVNAWHFGPGYTLDTDCRVEISSGLYEYFTLSQCRRDDLIFER